jgi:UDP-N-acetylglucosamine--N-acetylmuramyl-(pentapeptide) pyrophosphoryl-undecaprenol N-acetylglucosamine transferase
MIRNAPSVLFAAGGTGGHLFPALAVAHAVELLEPNARIRFVGARGRLEEEVVPREGFPLDLLWISGLDRRLSLRNLILPVKMVWSLLQAWMIMRRFRPDVVVAVGAFVSWPVGKVAQWTGRPLVLMESNAMPGMVIRRLAPKASEIHTAFEETAEMLGKARSVVSGNPVRRELLDTVDRREARRHFGLHPDKPTILVFGGSLGAGSINRAMDGLVEALRSDGVQVIWQTGKNYVGDEVKENDLYRTRFLYEMPKAYAAADLVICRAGATTMAELKVAGKPAILVPLPGAPDDHQTVNAAAMEGHGAARMIQDSKLGEQLYGLITELLARPDLLESMGQRAMSMGVRDADQRIAARILEIARERANSGSPK